MNEREMMMAAAEDIMDYCFNRECREIEEDDYGHEWIKSVCPFLDGDSYCKIGDPSSWDL